MYLYTHSAITEDRVYRKRKEEESTSIPPVMQEII